MEEKYERIRSNGSVNINFILRYFYLLKYSEICDYVTTTVYHIIHVLHLVKTLKTFCVEYKSGNT